MPEHELRQKAKPKSTDQIVFGTSRLPLQSAPPHNACRSLARTANRQIDFAQIPLHTTQDPIQVKSVRSTPAATAGSSRETKRPAKLSAGIESLSGISMANVNVHYNPPQPSRVQAFAYAKGNDIYLGPVQEKHLPREAWHVEQQTQGRVTAQNAFQLNDDSALQQEAPLITNEWENLFHQWHENNEEDIGNI